MESLDALAGLTARLASTVRLNEVVDAVVEEIVKLGFGAVWLAVLDERTGVLSTIKEVIDGVDSTHDAPPISSHDLRLPIGHSFRDRRMVNVSDPRSMRPMEGDDDPLPLNGLALPRAVYHHLRNHPFVCGPLLGSRGEPVGALGLSSYHGGQVIPDSVVSGGAMRVLTDHLGLAMDRALRVAELDENLSKAQAAIANDARIKAVGELAAAVAHDLNNLAGIALLAVSVGARSPADAFSVLPRIERANKAIGDLVGRLQRIARPSSAEAEAAELHEIVEDILIMTKPILRERSIDIDVALAAVPPVRCDPVLIHRVVLNLLLNAYDALAAVPAERRRIQLHVRNDDGVVRLTVADTGPGIAPQILDRMFQPFVTTKGHSHMGLGLAAAHASLNVVGGQLTGRNAPTGGAVFEIALAAAPSVAPKPAPAERSPPARTEPAGRGKILAVDDDPDVVFIIHAYLEPLGYEVATATSSAQALDVLSTHSFDLVLCDIGMPGQSGLDMPRALRKRAYAGKLILMTGWDSEALSTDPRLAEADALLKKPFLGTELIDAISGLLAGTT